MADLGAKEYFITSGVELELPTGSPGFHSHHLSCESEFNQDLVYTEEKLRGKSVTIQSGFLEDQPEVSLPLLPCLGLSALPEALAEG